MKRVLEPELLDHLPPDDPRAIRSRSDLRRLNKIMRHAEIFADILTRNFSLPPKRLADIGAGDGSLMLQIAEKTGWRGVELTLVDQQTIVSLQTLARFESLGWQVQIIAGDVFDWAEKLSPPMDCIVANLFLHHFTDEKLSALFGLLEQKTNFFATCETRRSWPAITVSRLVGLIGCNSVTRHDAVLSMKSGFSERELSSLWPAPSQWDLEERSVKVVTHSFVARRKKVM